jgi:ABC-type glycerol-3-phosphate transport system substrate-binding protein
MTTKIRAAGAVRPRSRRSRRTALLAAGAALTLVAVAACGNSGGASTTGTGADGFKQATQTNGTLTVWVDSTRLAAAQLYQKENPTVKMDIVTYDGDANGSNSLQTKVDLYDRTGKGWPDVVFSAENNEVSWAVQAGFTAPLNEGLIPQSTLANWATGALDPCTVGGKVYCLRNDLSQEVLWYNATLMKQWGYTVPTTWEQYEQLGVEVAAQHPGYLIGSAGDPFTPEIYLWASQCQANDITGPRAVTVDVTSPDCTRMASLLDTLIKDGSITTQSVFSSSFDKNDANKVLMLAGPAWFGGSVFDSSTGLNTPKGQIAAAPLPAWSDSPVTSGDVGGGTWLLSAHSANLTAAVKFLTWVTTSNDYQGALAPGYPAYAPAAKVWLADQAASGYYATDISPVLQQAANEVWSGWGYGEFSQEAIWAATIEPGLTSGKTIVSMLPAWQSAISDYATSDGYQVSQ